MKIAIGLFAIVVSVALGVAAGYFVGIHSEQERQEEAFRALTLANSACSVDLYTRLLEGLRGNQEELMKDQLETLLDFAIIDVANDYSPKLDIVGNAAKSLALAKSYRVAHQHRNQIDDVAKQVDAALATAPKP